MFSFTAENHTNVSYYTFVIGWPQTNSGPYFCGGREKVGM
jgi:hypothetical protein